MSTKWPSSHLLIWFTLKCYISLFLFPYKVETKTNNISLQGKQIYAPYGPNFLVTGTVKGCDFLIKASVTDIYFKNFKVFADLSVEGVAGGVLDGLSVKLKYNNETFTWSGPGTNAFHSTPGYYEYNLTEAPVPTCSGRGFCIRSSLATIGQCSCNIGYAGTECQDDIFAQSLKMPVLPAHNPAYPSIPVGAYNGLLASVYTMATTPGAGGSYKALSLQLFPGTYKIAYNETFFVSNTDAPAQIANFPKALHLLPMSGTKGDIILDCDGHPRPYSLFSTYNQLHLTNITIRNCFSPSGPGIAIRGYSADTVVVLKGVTFINITSHHGGAIHLADAKRFDVFDSKFINNTALDIPNGFGGAIYNVGTSAEIYRSTFTGNKANLTAGAVYVVSTKTSKSTGLLMEDCIFERNSAKYQGGSVYIDDVDSTLSRCTFKENETIKLPGRARSGATGSVRLTDEHGGSGNLFLSGGHYTLSYLTFENNNAETLGGAVYVNSDATVRMNDCLIHGNRALFGGGVYLIMSALTMRNVTFDNNFASIEGGAIFGNVAYIEISEGSKVIGNIAQEGGGLSLLGSTIKANYGTLKIEGNTALRGGGLSSRGHSAVQIPGSILSGNKATEGNGGAILLVEQCNFDGTNSTCSTNEAPNGYGGCMDINSSEGSVTLNRTSFTNNTAAYGGAISSAISSLSISTLKDINFISNSASVCGGAIFLKAKSVDDTKYFLCKGCSYVNQAAVYGSNIATPPVRITVQHYLSPSSHLSKVQMHDRLINPSLSVAIVDSFNQTAVTISDTRIFATLINVNIPPTDKFPITNPQLSSASAKLYGSDQVLSVKGTSHFTNLGIRGYFAGYYTLSFRAFIRNPFVNSANGYIDSSSESLTLYYRRNYKSTTIEAIDALMIVFSVVWLVFIYVLQRRYKDNAHVEGSKALLFSTSAIPMLVSMLLYSLYALLIISFLSTMSESYEIEHDESLLFKLCGQGLLIAFVGGCGVYFMAKILIRKRVMSVLIIHSNDDEHAGQEVFSEIDKNANLTCDIVNCEHQQQIPQILDIIGLKETVIFIMSSRSVKDMRVNQVLFSAYDHGLKMIVVMNEGTKISESKTWQSTKGSLKMMMAGKPRVSLLDKNWMTNLIKRIKDEDATNRDKVQSRNPSIIAENSIAFQGLSSAYKSKVNAEVIAKTTKTWILICTTLDFICFIWAITVFGTFVAMPRWDTYASKEQMPLLLLLLIVSILSFVILFPLTMRYSKKYLTIRTNRKLKKMSFPIMLLNLLVTMLYIAAAYFSIQSWEVWYEMSNIEILIFFCVILIITCICHCFHTFCWTMTFCSSLEEIRAETYGSNGKSSDMDDTDDDSQNEYAKRHSVTTIPDELLKQVCTDGSQNMVEKFERRSSLLPSRKGPLKDESREDESTKEFDIFLSYKHDNMEEARTVQKLLMTANYSVWLDTMIEPGENWREQVAGSLENSKTVVFLGTEKSMKSQFCQEEIFYASEMKKTLIPLTLETTCFQALRKQTLLNSILAPIQFIDFRNVDEGIAVLDVRLRKVLKRA